MTVAVSASFLLLLLDSTSPQPCDLLSNLRAVLRLPEQQWLELHLVLLVMQQLQLVLFVKQPLMELCLMLLLNLKQLPVVLLD